MDAERNEQARSEAMMMAMQRLHEDRALDNASMFELGDAMRSRYASPLASGAKRGKEHYIERISSTDPDAPANTLTPQAGSPQDYIDSGYLQRVGHRGLAEGGADMHDFDISPPSTR
jgi:hypothetical protein